jgi:hypothetical protein
MIAVAVIARHVLADAHKSAMLWRIVSIGQARTEGGVEVM